MNFHERTICWYNRYFSYLKLFIYLTYKLDLIFKFACQNQNMPYFRKILIVVSLLFSQLVIGQMSNYKSLYLYNFMKRIEWPQTNQNDYFTVVVFGDHETYNAMSQISELKVLGEREIEVIELKSTENLIKADLIYVDYTKRKYLQDISVWIENKPILLVCDYENSSIPDINLDENSGGLEFVIRPSQIRNKGLKISDQLIQLAKQVE